MSDNSFLNLALSRVRNVENANPQIVALRAANESLRAQVAVLMKAWQKLKRDSVGRLVPSDEWAMDNVIANLPAEAEAMLKRLTELEEHAKVGHAFLLAVHQAIGSFFNGEYDKDVWNELGKHLAVDSLSQRIEAMLKRLAAADALMARCEERKILIHQQCGSPSGCHLFCEVCLSGNADSKAGENWHYPDCKLEAYCKARET